MTNNNEILHANPCAEGRVLRVMQLDPKRGTHSVPGGTLSFPFWDLQRLPSWMTESKNKQILHGD